MNQLREGTHRAEQFAPFLAQESLLPLPDAYTYCRRITRNSSSNFYYAFHLLSLTQRNALCALYAFCRFLDDITDHPNDSSTPSVHNNGADRLAALLDMWRDELRAAYAGTPHHPISQALADTVRRFPIQQEHLAGIIDGVEMDLHRTRYHTFTELYEYCYHVASLVGLVCIEIFGYRNPDTRTYAVDLGVAFQLTNILRDVGEDQRRGRIYLPEEDLARFGYVEHDLCTGVYNDAFVRLMTFEAERAREYYRRAIAHLSPEDRRTLAAAEAMRLIYSRLLDKLVARGFAVFTTRVTLPTLAKIALAVTAWGRSRLSL